MEDQLRDEDGWLTLVGLYWLREGENTIGSDPECDILLPPNTASHRLGVIELSEGQVVLRVSSDEDVLIDEAAAKTGLLRDDSASGGPSIVRTGAVSFLIIKRNDQYGVRVRDRNNLARQTFSGRKWFPVDPVYRITGIFKPYTIPRLIQVINIVGMITPTEVSGYVEFTLGSQNLRLDAFNAGDDQLWFVFKDRTSGIFTYKASRFLYASLSEDNRVVLDFNKAYHPACVFTPYATCPRPFKENILPVAVEAGERY